MVEGQGKGRNHVKNVGHGHKKGHTTKYKESTRTGRRQPLHCLGILPVADRIWMQGCSEKNVRSSEQRPCKKFMHARDLLASYILHKRANTLGVSWQTWSGEAECQEDDEKYERVKTEAFH